MQGQWTHDEPYYRCRFPNEYGLANKIQHPRNIYLAEKDILPPIDGWLATAFAPHHLDTTITKMYESQPEPEDDSRLDATNQIVAECDEKLARYRQALEAGTDPVLVATWTAEVQARRAEALAQTRTKSKQRRMSRAEISNLVDALGSIRTVLAHAEPTDKAEIYRRLGMRLTYEPAKRRVRAEASLDPHTWGYGLCPREDSASMHTCSSGRQRSSLRRDEPGYSRHRERGQPPMTRHIPERCPDSSQGGPNVSA